MRDPALEAIAKVLELETERQAAVVRRQVADSVELADREHQRTGEMGLTISIGLHDTYWIGWWPKDLAQEAHDAADSLRDALRDTSIWRPE